MSRNRLPPPDPSACLVRPASSSQKGGTLIAEDVTDMAQHARRICDPDGYRPARCPRCHHDVLHVHQYRERVLRADPDEPVATVVVHQCAHCGATWRILPAFVARRLWRSWRTVEIETLQDAPPRDRPKVPSRTVQRWLARLAAAARHLVQVLAASGEQTLWRLAVAVGMHGTRRELVEAAAAASDTPSGRWLADPAALVHRLCPGVRLV